MAMHYQNDVNLILIGLQFLERCTSALNLPFAARRLFDEEGRELHTLKGLKRDQLVYATCGELWTDPRLSKAEQQRRYLLTGLANDLTQIRQFCALRDTEGIAIDHRHMCSVSFSARCPIK